MHPIKLTGTLREEIEERVASPHYHPDLQTVIAGVSLPGDSEWEQYAFTDPTGKRRLRYLNLPGNDPDQSPYYPPKFIGRIGQTGWDYRRCVARFLTFEFDSFEGHTKGLTPDQMQTVREWLQTCPHISANASTSGKGIHCRLLVNLPCPTSAEYLRLRKQLVTDYLRDSPFDPHFVDLGGRGNLWIWRNNENTATT